jgi:hypothetical protein
MENGIRYVMNGRGTIVLTIVVYNVSETLCSLCINRLDMPATRVQIRYVNIY